MELALAVASVSILAVAGYGALTQQSAMASSRTPTPPSRPSTASLETTTPGSLTIYPGMRGFTRGGQQGYWFQSGLGVAGTALYAYANGSTRENWARWTFDLSKDGSGFYNATVFVPSNHATTGNARYLVNTAQGPVTVSVDQKPYYDTWVSLGTYEFDASAAWIQVDDATGEVYADTESPQIGVDAMRLIPVN